MATAQITVNSQTHMCCSVFFAIFCFSILRRYVARAIQPLFLKNHVNSFSFHNVFWNHLHSPRRCNRCNNGRNDHCVDSRTKEQIKPRRVLECRNGKTKPLSSFPPPCCNYYQNCIICLPSYSIKRRYLPYSSPTYTRLIQSANDRQDPYPTPCTLDIKVD